MKKIMIILLLLIFYIGVSCELNYQLQSEFGFGGIGYLQYSNGRIYSTTAYGSIIYEIQENGNLDVLSNVRTIPGWGQHYYSHDRLVVYSGYMSFKNNEDFGSYFTIYDMSVPNEQTILYHTQIDIDNMFAVELFEDYFIRKTGDHQYTIFDYESYQPVSQIYNISLLFKSKFNDQGGVLLDYSDNCYYYYEIDEIGILNKKYNLGEEEKRVAAITENKLIAYTMGNIKVFNITESDSLEFTGATFYNNEPFNSLVYAENKLFFTSQEGLNPKKLMLKMYEIDDENNFTLLDTEELAESPASMGVPNSSLILDNNSLYVSLLGERFIQANFTDEGFEMLDVNYIERGYSSPHGFIKNNKFYTMCFDGNTTLHSYSLDNYLNVQQIENDFPKKSGYWYFEEESKIVRFDEVLGCFYFYDWEDDNLILTDSYNLEGFVDTTFLNPYKWDGNQFIYRRDSSLISVIKENGEFTESWVLDGSLAYYTYNYEVYQNYIYELKPNRGIRVYSFNESEYQLINSLTVPFNSGFEFIFLRGDILTTNQKNIIDLSSDPVGLSMRYDLNQYHINSGAVKYYDYLMYCGDEKIETDTGIEVIHDILSVYKLNDNVPFRVGTIESEYTISDFEIIEGGAEDSFDILVSNINYFSIYSCQATPNGQLEITPVTLNALNYPNPFNPETTISYDVAQSGSVTVDIYNLKGQKVKSLLNENKEAGKHSIIWQGDNDDGKQVGSGTYFYRVKSGEQEVVKKMMLLK